jgi:hypothetical protein
VLNEGKGNIKYQTSFFLLGTPKQTVVSKSLLSESNTVLNFAVLNWVSVGSVKGGTADAQLQNLVSLRWRFLKKSRIQRHIFMNETFRHQGY